MTGVRKRRSSREHDVCYLTLYYWNGSHFDSEEKLKWNSAVLWKAKFAPLTFVRTCAINYLWEVLISLCLSVCCGGTIMLLFKTTFKKLWSVVWAVRVMIVKIFRDGYKYVIWITEIFILEKFPHTIQKNSAMLWPVVILIYRINLINRVIWSLSLSSYIAGPNWLLLCETWSNLFLLTSIHVNKCHNISNFLLDSSFFHIQLFSHRSIVMCLNLCSWQKKKFLTISYFFALAKPP